RRTCALPLGGGDGLRWRQDTPPVRCPPPDRCLSPAEPDHAAIDLQRRSDGSLPSAEIRARHTPLGLELLPFFGQPAQATGPSCPPSLLTLAYLLLAWVIVLTRQERKATTDNTDRGKESAADGRKMQQRLPSCSYLCYPCYPCYPWLSFLPG